MLKDGTIMGLDDSSNCYMLYFIHFFTYMQYLENCVMVCMATKPCKKFYVFLFFPGGRSPFAYSDLKRNYILECLPLDEKHI